MDLVTGGRNQVHCEPGKPEGDRPEDGVNGDGNNEWMMMGRLHGWKTVKEKCTTQCATFGVLSALLLTLSFPVFISPPDFNLYADEDGKSPCGVDVQQVS